MKKILFIALLFCIKQTNGQIITTVVGTGYGAGTGMGNYSGDGGLATIAEMQFPDGIVFDKHGNLFVAIYGDGIIRKVNTADTITKFAGQFSQYNYNGNSGNADTIVIPQPEGMAFDAKGNLYVADGANSLIRKIDSQHISTVCAGNYYKGLAISALGVPGGYGGDGGVADSAILNQPADVAFDKHGNMYIADFGNNLVRKVDTLGIITTFAGDTTGLSNPNCTNCNIGYNGDGKPANKTKLGNPMGVTFDKLGNLYIAENATNLVRKVDTLGIITTIVGDTTGARHYTNSGYSGDGGQATLAKLYGPTKICFDSHNNMYVAEQYNSTIRKVTTAGVISTFVGTGGVGYTGDNGPAIAATLNQPYYILCDSLDNLFIADWYNNVIRKVSTSTIEIEQLSNNNPQVKTYPNPAQNNFTIETSSTEKQNVALYDINGKQVLSQTINGTTNIDASNLSAGVYNLSLTNNQGTTNKRLVIIK